MSEGVEKTIEMATELRRALPEHDQEPLDAVVLAFKRIIAELEADNKAMRGLRRCPKDIKRIAELEAAAQMKDKRIDWTVQDNAKKAIKIEELEAELLKVTNERRALLDPSGELLPPLLGKESKDG